MFINNGQELPFRNSPDIAVLIRYNTWTIWV